MVADALVRTRATTPQSELDASGRRRNLRDAFEAITDVGSREKDVVLLTEYVRVALKREIADRYADDASRDSLRQAYLPFGMGPRVCLGAAFALQEATLILAQLVRHQGVNLHFHGGVALPAQHKRQAKTRKTVQTHQTQRRGTCPPGSAQRLPPASWPAMPENHRQKPKPQTPPQSQRRIATTHPTHPWATRPPHRLQTTAPQKTLPPTQPMRATQTPDHATLRSATRPSICRQKSNPEHA